MNNYLAIKMFCLIKEIESASSKEDKNKYLKNEDKADKDFINAHCNYWGMKVSPWIDDLTEGNEINEIKNNILSNSSKIHSYLYSFDIHSDAYIEIVFDELKKYYINNSIEYDEDEVYQNLLEDISNKNIDLRIFKQDTRKLINILFMIDDIDEECVNLIKSK